MFPFSGCESEFFSDFDGFHTDGVSCWQESRNIMSLKESCLEIQHQRRSKFQINVRHKNTKRQQNEQVYFQFHYMVETPIPKGVPPFYIRMDNHPETWFTLIVRVKIKNVELFPYGPKDGVSSIISISNNRQENRAGDQIRRYGNDSVIKLALFNHTLLNMTQQVKTDQLSPL